MKKRIWIPLLILLLAALAYGAAIFYRTAPSSIDGSIVQGNFGTVSLNIELATTETSRERGLGGRTSIGDAYGMLFVFQTDGLWNFWMKDTLIPLDMFWLNSKGQVIYMKEDILPSTYPETFGPDVGARFVLETKAGFGALHSINVGTQLHLQNGVDILK